MAAPRLAMRDGVRVNTHFILKCGVSAQSDTPSTNKNHSEDGGRRPRSANKGPARQSGPDSARSSSNKGGPRHSHSIYEGAIHVRAVSAGASHPHAISAGASRPHVATKHKGSAPQSDFSLAGRSLTNICSLQLRTAAARSLISLKSQPLPSASNTPNCARPQLAVVVI